MIDWVSLGFGALWISGLGLVTAALSFAYYLAGQQKQRLRQILKMPACQIMVDLGLVFFCLGLAGGVSEIWERILWVVLALIFMLPTRPAMKMSNS